MQELDAKKLEKFRELIKKSTDTITILLSHIDPDSIACAKVFAKICQHFDKIPIIFYAGKIDDPQNIAIWNHFALAEDFIPFSRFLEDPKMQECDCALLDSSALEDTRFGDNIILNPTFIIDHHLPSEKMEELENKWYWVSSYGSAATMIAKLFMELGLEFDVNDDLATLVELGILIDNDAKLISKHTKHMDREVFTAIMHFVDASKLRELSSVKDKKYFLLLNKAINNMVTEEKFTITNIGYVSEEDVGYTARIADELSEAEKNVIIWAISNYNIHIKVRSCDDNVPLDAFIKKHFKTGGARHGKGAAKILPPHDFYIPNSPEEKEIYLKYISALIKGKAKSQPE